MSDDNVYIPKQDFDRLSRYSLRDKDILVSVVGTLGNAAIVTQKDLPAIFSCKSTVLRVFDINPEYLVVYLNSLYGKKLLLRRERGAIQKGLNLEDLKELDVFIPSVTFQNQIEKIFIVSLKSEQKSKRNYDQAKEILLKEIGFHEWVPNTTSIASQKSSTVFNAKRFDAEFYQSKYKSIEQKIHSYRKGSCNIAEKFHLIKDNNLKNIKSSNYIEIGDINIENGDYIFSNLLVKELPANAKITPHIGDILVSKVRPNRGAVAIINDKINNLIVSGAFSVLREKSNFKKESLFVLLRTDIYKDLLLKWNVGTSYPVIKDEDIMNLPIPLIDNKIQEEISSLIQNSFQLRKESDNLLELAKKAVEVAIEQGEEEAMKLLNDVL